MAKEKVIVSWSGGKDSAFSLFEIFKSQKVEVIALITNVVKEDQRIKMQGVRCELLEAQAKSLGIPLETVPVSRNPKNDEYEKKTGAVIEKYKALGATAMVFGDLFLEDIKKYRDACLKKWNFSGLYPIWLRPTRPLAHEMIREGFRTIVTCVDTTQLDPSFAGREFDEDYLKDLPDSVDPCGEQGEFHTFVYDGPYFKEKVAFAKNDFFFKDGRFYYCDLQKPETLAASKRK